MGSDVLDALVLELRRGTLALSVLSQLREPRYGYALAQGLAASNLQIEQGTLYPLLRRLEKQGLLTSDWSIEDARPRRYYVLSDAGRETLARLTGEWNKMIAAVSAMLADLMPSENSMMVTEEE